MTTGISALGLYEPVWDAATGGRKSGVDEDVVTLAVSAARSIPAEHLARTQRVVLITRRPDQLLGPTPDAILTGLHLDRNLPFEERIGGAPSVLQALGSDSGGTLFIAVDPGPPTASAAAVTGVGADLTFPRVERFALPVASRWVSDPLDHVYDDIRLLRNRGWSRAIAGTEPSDSAFIVGLSSKDAAKFTRRSMTVPTREAASALFAVAAALEDGGGDVVAVENGLASAVTVGVGPGLVRREQRAGLQAPATWDPASPADITISLPAYERNFQAKVGFIALQCSNGHVMYPPRLRCSVCGLMGPFDPVELPRTGCVYSIVTVHTPVPGKSTPYTLAVVDVEDTDLRVLVHVTDAQPGLVDIGASGRLVLRRIAVRQGIPDYGMAFQPGESQ